jgi:hypothetical protein
LRLTRHPSHEIRPEAIGRLMACKIPERVPQFSQERIGPSHSTSLWGVNGA